MRISETTGNGSITAKDIGRALGLSQPTVSRILSGAANHRVSAETRRRVLETAERMGYRPNAVARSLRRRRTHIVGFYTGYGYLDARNAFLAAVIGGLQRACDDHRLDLLLHGVFRGGSTDDIYGELVDGRIDGLFLHTHASDPLVARLVASSLPVVAVADAIPGVPSVTSDDEAGTRLLVEHLWARGHRRIGYVRPTIRFTSVEARAAAFTAAMAERGVPAAHRPVIETEYETAEPVLDALLALPEPPTAVCCWNDLAAYNLIYACRQRGVRVPEELAVAGFDGLLDPRLVPRPLVTVGADWNAVADRAMSLLVRQIHARHGAGPEGEADEIPPLTRLPVRLIGGDTV
jgi:DNA-binding LacI/PurR family transcriptional regulator